MKRFIVSFCVLFCAVSIFAEADKIVRCDLGFATGIPVYSYRDDNVYVKDSRAIIGTISDISFRLGNPLRLVTGVDIVGDFMWDGGDYNHHLDYAFWSGIKFYPGLGGLNFSIAYALGCRTDFVKYSSRCYGNFSETSFESKYMVVSGIVEDSKVVYTETDSYVESTAWGNGFRISFDYDFLYNSKLTVAPALGGYYRCIPRGNNNWDNIFAVYLTFGF